MNGQTKGGYNVYSSTFRPFAIPSIIEEVASNSKKDEQQGSRE